ncbi:MAG: hypothetical protein JWO03_1485 [Bacteroidetes bacterium]|nr:hypothetical protein [Bacteroidota bacterium]
MLNPIRLVLTVVLITTLTQLYAQTSSAPQGINYQSVARDASGQILINQQISLQLTIHDTISSGAIVYRERHVVVTNAFGTFSVVVGGGSLVTGNFGNINWGAADKYLQAEMDFAGGTSYTNLGTSRLNSVPYALYAGSSSSDISNVKYDTTGILNIQTASHTISTVKGTWLEGGNGGLTTANNYLGTTTNTDIRFIRGGKEAVRYTTGGAFLATGDTATGTTPASGAGKRMEWIPAKGAFRAGTVTGTAWDNASIGANSTAFGNDAMASGANTVAIGNNAQALCANSIAIGNGAITKSPSSLVIGMYNDTSAASTGSIGQSDILFQIGDGTSATSRGNALTVSKTGQVLASQLSTQTITLQPSAASSLLGNVAVNPQNQSFIVVSCLGLPLNNSMTLVAGVRGQILTIEGQASLLGISLGFGVRLNDSGNLSLNSNVDLLSGDSITLIYDGTTWVEISRSINH